MDISTKEGREALRGCHLAVKCEHDIAKAEGRAPSSAPSVRWLTEAADHMPAALRLLDERDAEIECMEKLLDHWKTTSMNDTARAEKLTAERDEAERLYSAKCSEHHQALVAESRAGSALGRARATLREIMTFYSAALPLRVRERANDAFSPETPAAPLPISGNRPDGAVKLDPLPHAPNSWQRSRFETQLAAPSPVTDEMVEAAAGAYIMSRVERTGESGMVHIHDIRAALTAALGRKP